VIASFDDCLTRLTELRAVLVAARPVRPGERLAAVEEAIVVADTFAALAARAIAGDPAGVV